MKSYQTILLAIFALVAVSVALPVVEDTADVQAPTCRDLLKACIRGGENTMKCFKNCRGDCKNCPGAVKSEEPKSATAAKPLPETPKVILPGIPTPKPCELLKACIKGGGNAEKCFRNCGANCKNCPGAVETDEPSKLFKVGSKSGSCEKTITGTAGYVCPKTLTKNTWAMEGLPHANCGDKFEVTQTGDSLTVKRVDAGGRDCHGWGMKLQFHCTKPAVVEEKPKPCPVPMCPKMMPKPGCKFVPSKEMDANGCPKHPCGKQECVKCPVPMCPKVMPRPGCKFVPSKEMDANGCPKHPCGKQECPVCPQVKCMFKPKPGCKLEKSKEKNAQGCLKHPCGIQKCKPKCKPVSTATADAGYTDAYRGWYDVQGCGTCNDYCRWVGDTGSGGNPAKKLHVPGGRNPSWWSCRLAGTNKNYSPRSQFRSFKFKKCSGKGAKAN
jgi:hypothetical protein